MDADESLIRDAQTGNAEAFERLLERHYETIYRFAYKWCGKREDAEDITQQACLKLARGLASYRFESAFTSWLYRLVINCANDWARTQGRHSSQELAPDQPAQESPGTGNAVEHQTYLWQLLQALDELPEGLKETLLLVHAEGLSHSQAARVLEVSESTVSWRLHEFRKHYRLSVEEGG